MCILFPVCTHVNSVVKYNLCSWIFPFRMESNFIFPECLLKMPSLELNYQLFVGLFESLVAELILASDIQFSYLSLLNAGVIGTYQPHLACHAIFLLLPPLPCLPLLSSFSSSSFFDNVLLCSQDCFWTHYVAQSRWTYRNLPASVSWVVPCCLTKATNSCDLSLPSWGLCWGWCDGPYSFFLKGLRVYEEIWQNLCFVFDILSFLGLCHLLSFGDR